MVFVNCKMNPLHQTRIMDPVVSPRWIKFILRDSSRSQASETDLALCFADFSIFQQSGLTRAISLKKRVVDFFPPVLANRQKQEDLSQFRDPRNYSVPLLSHSQNFRAHPPTRARASRILGSSKGQKIQNSPICRFIYIGTEPPPNHRSRWLDFCPDVPASRIMRDDGSPRIRFYFFRSLATNLASSKAWPFLSM